MKQLYFTITGCRYYYGSELLEKNMEVSLVKEPDNQYDNEAIQVKIKGLGKCGYVANSTYNVKGESMSAGRLYDKLGDEAKGMILFVIPDGAIGVVTETGLEREKNLKRKKELNRDKDLNEEDEKSGRNEEDRADRGDEKIAFKRKMKHNRFKKKR